MAERVLPVERFDRVSGTEQRPLMVSALTMLDLPETAPREASYARLAELVRERFVDPRNTLRELFARITFNILLGNTDDHAEPCCLLGRSHAHPDAGYDICTYVRGGAKPWGGSNEHPSTD